MASLLEDSLAWVNRIRCAHNFVPLRALKKGKPDTLGKSPLDASVPRSLNFKIDGDRYSWTCPTCRINHSKTVPKNVLQFVRAFDVYKYPDLIKGLRKWGEF